MIDDIKDQAMTKRILEIAHAGRTGYATIYPSALANDFQVLGPDVEQKLAHMAAEGLISVVRDSYVRHYFNTTITYAGQQSLSRMSKQPIGF